MRSKWKITLATLLGIVVVFIAYLFLSQVYEREMVTRKFRQTVQDAASAEIKLWIIGGGTTTQPIPPEQFARLKELLLHVRPPRPAMGQRLHIIIDPAGCLDIVFADAEGKKLNYALRLKPHPNLMPESQAEELSLLRRKNVYEPNWYLPDAELDELYALPIVAAFFKQMKEELAKRFPCPCAESQE